MDYMLLLLRLAEQCDDCEDVDWCDDSDAMTDVMIVLTDAMTVAEWLVWWLWRNDWCDDCGGMTGVMTVPEWLMRWL